MNIRISKIFDFEMAHVLTGYDGLCKNVHGHSYFLTVTVLGRPIAETASKKRGMVIDFVDLKKIVKQEIIDKYDHAIVIRKDSKLSNIQNVEQAFDRMILVDYQPTSENLVLDFAKKIQALLPSHLKLFSVKLQETSTSYAEWHADDN